jgi:hypothetical protein
MLVVEGYEGSVVGACVSVKYVTAQRFIILYMYMNYYIAEHALSVQEHREGPIPVFVLVTCGKLHWPK